MHSPSILPFFVCLLAFAAAQTGPQNASIPACVRPCDTVAIQVSGCSSIGESPRRDPNCPFDTSTRIDSATPHLPSINPLLHCTFFRFHLLNFKAINSTNSFNLMYLTEISKPDQYCHCIRAPTILNSIVPCITAPNSTCGANSTADVLSTFPISILNIFHPTAPSLNHVHSPLPWSFITPTPTPTSCKSTALLAKIGIPSFEMV